MDEIFLPPAGLCDASAVFEHLNATSPPRAIRFSDVPYYQAVNAFVMTSMARHQEKPRASASASTKNAAKMVWCVAGATD